MTLVGPALWGLVVIWAAGLIIAGYLVLPRLRELLRPDATRSMR
jgi:hypothetical protein